MATRILVVEDNPVTLKMLRVALGSGGYQVIEALDAQTALEKAEQDLPDLILMDLVLPDLDGIDLLGQLRLLQGGGELPILALSGFMSRLGESRTLEAGFTSILPKPIEPNALLDAVRTHLPKPHATSPVAGGRQRLLIVDDDAVQLKLSRLHFTHLGFEVIAVGGAAAALASARDRPPSVILSDVFMPDVDGFQLCLDVRQDPALADVPVVLMSNTYGSKADQDLARRVGASALVLRTPDFEEARAAVVAALESPARVAGEQPTDALRLKHARLVNQQLERQLATLTGMAQRCVLQSAQISLLSSVADALTRHGDTDLVVRDVLAATLDAAGISKGALILREAAGELKLRQAIGFSESERAGLGRFFGHLAHLERIIDAGVSVSVPSRSIPAGASNAILTGSGVKTMHIVPLASDGGPSGAMLIGASNTDVTGDDSVAFARAMGNQLVQSLALTRSVSLLTASEKRYRTLFQSATDAIATITPNGVLRDLNPRWEEILGRPEAELVGRDLREFAAPGYADENAEAYVRALSPAGGRTPALPIMRGDGSIAWIEFAQTNVDLGGEQVVFTIGRDVTEQRSLEDQLRQAQKLEAVGQLAGGVAHDFNNVLTAILGFTKLLKDELRGDDSKLELLEEVQHAAERAAALTRQLLAFSRKQLLQPKILDVNGLVMSIEPMLRRLIPENIDLRVVLTSQVSTIRIDPSQLEQILMNLVVNSAHAMRQGGKLTIETANMALGQQLVSRLPVTPGEYVMLAVSDTGIGIDAATLSHIFEPFFTTKGVGEGTGLGLSTVYGIVKQSDGDIWVYSEPGHGTTFKIFLPAVAEGAKRQADEPQSVSSATRGTGTILLVEDDASVRRFARLTLEQAGYQVLEASSPVDAIRVVGKWGKPIDLLLSDVIMPDAIGAPLFARLAPLHAGLRVLYMSGYTDEAVVRQGLLIEGTPFLQKPFAPETLLEKVREVLAVPPEID